jgi:hypothetical protein
MPRAHTSAQTHLERPVSVWPTIGQRHSAKPPAHEPGAGYGAGCGAALVNKHCRCVRQSELKSGAHLASIRSLSEFVGPSEVGASVVTIAPASAATVAAAHEARASRW